MMMSRSLSHLLKKKSFKQGSDLTKFSILNFVSGAQRAHVDMRRLIIKIVYKRLVVAWTMVVMLRINR